MTRGILQCLCRPFVRGRVAASVNTNVPADAKFKLEWEQGPVKGTFEAAPTEAKKIKGAEILYDDGSRKFYDTAFAASKKEILDATDVRASDLKKVIENRSKEENLIQNLSDFNTVTSAAKTVLAPGVIGYNIVKANSQHSDGVVQQAVKKSDLGSIYDIVSG